MCNDLLRVCDEESPCPSYTRDMDSWLDDFNDYIDDCFPPDEIDTISMSQSVRFVQNIFRSFMSKEMSGPWVERSVEERLAHVDTLAASVQVAQRSPEWYKQSKGLLTASEFSNILGTPRAVSNLALQKVAPLSENLRQNTTACCTPEMSPFDWGIRFEPVVKQVLERMDRIKILEMGRVVHPTNPRLAASPDGIIIGADDSRRIGRLLEIKCPITRKIDGVIPQDYWYQMQIQMEVTDIDECDYVEMSFESGYKTHMYTDADSKDTCSTDLYDLETARPSYCGNMWLLQDPESLELKYAYTCEEKDAMEQGGWCVHEVIQWHLKKLFRTTVIRNREWYASTLPKQEEFWKRVEDARQGLIEPPTPKKRSEKVVVQVCKIVGDFDTTPPVPVSESTEDLSAAPRLSASTPVETRKSTE
jgi:putative phage-type endonuclease